MLLRFFRRLSSLVGIPVIHQRLDDLEQMSARFDSALGPTSDHVERRLSELGGALTASLEVLNNELQRMSAGQLDLHNQQAAHFENRLASLNEALVAYVDAKQEQQSLALGSSSDEISARLTQLRQSMDALRLQLSATSSSSVTPAVGDAPAVRPSSVIDDAFYVALENHFRGSRDLIAERQQVYVTELPVVVTDQHPVVDLGCGRGEWLLALKEQGIPVRGVDSNVVCVTECASKGLDVELDDLVTFLGKQPDQSVGAFTLFQVLEHLPFDVLLTTLRQIRRVLVPGGRLIAEVPNAKNLRVSAGTFWIDPTHHRPLYPELLLFLADEVGFSNATGIYSNDLSPKFDLSSLTDGPREALQRVVDAIDTAGDFALIATA